MRRPALPSHASLSHPSSRLLLRLALLILAALAVMGGGAGALAAQDRSVVIQDMRATYTVNEDATVAVEERFRVRFNGEWNGLQRVLELRPPEGYPWTEPYGFRLEGATNGEGEERRAEVLRDGTYTRDIRVYVPNARNRTATVVIRYTLSGALGFFDADPERELPALDEFYWQVTGTEWDAPILNASAEVRIPFTTGVSQAAAYQGGALSSDEVPVAIDGATARAQAEGRIDPGQGLTMGVGWPAGSVQRDPSRVMQWGEETLEERLRGERPGPLTYLPLLLPLVAFWFAFKAWDARGRDPKERSIMVRWDPPADLSPAEAGTLVDHNPHMHDIISTLVEMAVRGYIVIEEQEKEGFLQFGTDYVFHLIRPESVWGEDLMPHQERFLQGLFKRRESVGGILKDALGMDQDASVGAPPEAVASVKLSDLKNEFYEEIPDIKDAIFDNLVRKGHYLKRPDKVRGAWIGVAVVIAVLGVTGGAILPGTGALNPWAGIMLGLGAIASSLILMVFGWLMPARTEKGARTREAALGFKQFLEKVENPRYKRMIQSPDQFEEFLPYAMAFQCQEEWARAFDDLLKEPPDWYRGSRHRGFQPTVFAADMSSMASTASTAMASSPSSSGSGGGGSVGGGGGGGGGGGF